MIRVMACSWTATIEQLRQLNELRRFQQLKEALDGLPSTIPVEYQANLPHKRQVGPA